MTLVLLFSKVTDVKVISSVFQKQFFFPLYFQIGIKSVTLHRRFNLRTLTPCVRRPVSGLIHVSMWCTKQGHAFKVTPSCSSPSLWVIDYLTGDICSWPVPPHHSASPQTPHLPAQLFTAPTNTPGSAVLCMPTLITISTNYPLTPATLCLLAQFSSLHLDSL